MPIDPYYQEYWSESKTWMFEKEDENNLQVMTNIKHCFLRRKTEETTTCH